MRGHTMIVASLRQIAPKTGHDHELDPWDEPGGGAYVVGGADEVGAACAFLCSRQAGYITGQTLGIDGGALLGVH